MGRASFNIFNELNESFAEEVKKMQTPKKSLKERQAARKRNLIKEEAKVRGQKRYASLKENDWTVTYIPDPTKKDQTATISVSAVNKSEAVNKARQTIGQDCPITLVQPLQEADKVEIDKDGNKSIRDEKTGHLKKIIVSKKTQDKMADEYNKKQENNNKMSYEDWIDYIDIKEKYPEWFKNKSELNRPFLDIVNDHQDELWNDYQEYLKEDEVIQIPVTDQEPDYIIEDVTELTVVGDGDIQAPDIEGLLTLVDESLRTTYGDKWGHIRILSSNKMNENACYALVDISTPEIIKEFESRGIEDAAVGKNLILENNNGKITFKVNSLNGSTKFSKVTENAEVTIKEWIETEYLHEAMIEKFEEENQKKEKELKDTVENYIANRPDLKMEIANIEMFIEMGKSIKDEGFNEMVQNRMYGLAAEIPNTIKVKVDKDNKAEMSFGSLDDVVKLLFGEKYVKDTIEIPGNEVVGIVKESENKTISKIFDTEEELKKFVSKNKLKTYDITELKNGKWELKYNPDKKENKLKESYQQFNIGEIEVVFNPDTFECLYSIPSAEVQDKKINLSEIPTVETPYDTNTIIKDYVEKNFGRIPSEEPEQKEEPQPTNPEGEKPNEAPNPVTDDTTGTDTDINPDLAEPETEVEEAELPEEPAKEETSAVEQIPEEQPEEVPEEKKAETGSAVFVKIRPKQVAGLEDVREKLLDGNTPQANYIVVDEKDLTDEEWNKLTENLTEPESYLVGLDALDRKNYSFNVIKLKNSNANYDILVDPLGYDYPRYLAIIDK